MPFTRVSHHADPIDTLLTAYGLRRTGAAKRVLGWLLAHPDTSYTHAQLQVALQGNAIDLELAAKNALQTLKALGYQGLSLDLAVRGVCADCATASVASQAAAPVAGATA